MKTIFKTILCSIILFNINTVNAQKIIPLYNAEIPNSKAAPNKEKSEVGKDGILRISNVSIPTLSIYSPDKSSDKGTAVIICPGGGYKILAASHEGEDVAKELNKWGITAFVLKYRIPNDTIMPDKSTGPLQDAQRAIQLVRERAEEWNIDPQKIGIMGFSAGGHLAASASTRFNEILIENPKNTSLRPDFSILIYPVISFMDGITHRGSRENLMGKNPDPRVLKKYSNELTAGPQTPPAFLVHAGDDASVPVKNSIVYYEALLKHKIYSHMIIYPNGGHGFGMKNKTSTVQWMNQLKDWINDSRVL
ncbi:MAG: alpha/beta hydrolase [Daejeonella sp.]|uniref:alpha/beta hydrolase n=1 Tax=Daejeonella sp. TaxID=2805397 RepID=UPI0027368362|nr:alpha/beta hydrolase [Daejeonella sp.]MDP3470120.1 alpha/beta hydrolase [Daejeonella sp.]